MKRTSLIVAVLLALFACAVPASAQTVTNPTAVQFIVSADHAQLSKYVIGYFAAGATAPVMEADLPLGTPDANQQVTQPINARPLAFGAAYVVKVRAVAGTMSSEWSNDSNPFDRVPMPPASVLVRR
jgi:hypothetical protein